LSFYGLLSGNALHKLIFSVHEPIPLKNFSRFLGSFEPIVDLKFQG